CDRTITIPASVNVIPGSDVGDVHHTSPLKETTVITPNILPTKMYVINVKPSGKNILPTFQSIVSDINPRTKSMTISITFCPPVGFIFKLLAPSTQRINTIADAINIIKILDKLKFNHDIPNTFSSIGALLSTFFTPSRIIQHINFHKIN